MEKPKISITGIDGAGKDTVAKNSTLELARLGISPIVKLGRPTYVVEPDSVEEIFSGTNHFIDRVHGSADRSRNRLLITAANTLSVMETSRILEQRAEKKYQPEMMVSARDLRVDPVVYSDFYMNGFSRKLSTEQKIRAIQSLTGVERDLIVLLKINPEVAVERIENRIFEESKSRENVMRPKWRHMHENVEDLTKLYAGYFSAISVLKKIRPDTRVLEIETTNVSKKDVRDITVSTILDLKNDNIAPGETIKY